MNKHRGSDFNEFLIEQGLTNTNQPMTPTPRTDAIQFQGWPDDCIPKLARLARDLERELAAERELADRLAEMLANVQGDYASTGAITTQEVAESLTSWKEARNGTC